MPDSTSPIKSPQLSDSTDTSNTRYSIDSSKFNSQFRIAESYNVRDDPIYDPVALSEPVWDEQELAENGEGEYTSGSDFDSSSASSTRKLSFSPVLGHRKSSVTPTIATRKQSLNAAPAQRRRSTVVSQAPSEIVTWGGVHDPENPKNVSHCWWAFQPMHALTVTSGRANGNGLQL